VSDFAIASKASGGNEFVLDHGFFDDGGAEATCTARGFARCAVMGGNGSIGGKGVLRACLISRELAKRWSSNVLSASVRGPRISKAMTASLTTRPATKAAPA
jgi:hypothetical protein